MRHLRQPHLKKYLLGFFLKGALSHHAHFKLCTRNKMMAPVLFWQSVCFRAFRVFRGSNSRFLPFAGTLKGPSSRTFMNEKENSNYQPRKTRKARKYIKQPNAVSSVKAVIRAKGRHRRFTTAPASLK
jgi:hypothetical protein